MRRSLVVPVVVIVLAVSAGCSSDDTGEDPGEASTSAASAEPDQPPSSEESSPTVAPATGPVLTQPAASLRLPEGWVDGEFPGDIQRVGETTSGSDSSMIFLSQIRTLGSEDKDLAQLAEDAAADGYDGQGTIEEETEIQGVPVYHVTGQVNGKDTEAFGTIVDRDLVVVKFIFDEGTRDELQQEIIAEVFAGFEWTA